MHSEGGFKTCVIDSILLHRENTEGRYEFLIKWKRSAPSWEPIENLTQVKDLILEYLNKNETVRTDSWVKKQHEHKFLNTIQKDILHKREQQLKVEDTSMFKKQLFEKVQNQICKTNYDLTLRYNEIFPQFSERSKREFKMKDTSKYGTIESTQSDKVEWSDIKRAWQIQWHQTHNKWMVEVQFHNNDSKIWIQRDILRLLNPFILLQLYTRIQRKQIQSQIHQQKYPIEEQSTEQQMDIAQSKQPYIYSLSQDSTDASFIIID